MLTNKMPEELKKEWWEDEFDKFTLDNEWAGRHYNQLKFLISSLLASYEKKIEELEQEIEDITLETKNE